MHETDGVCPGTQGRTCPTLLPGQGWVVFTEPARQLDPMHVHIHIPAVDVFGEDQRELAGFDIHFGIIPERTRVVQIIVGRSRPAVHRPPPNISPGRVAIIIRPGGQGDWPCGG
jgi:hypothetical protein